MTCSNFLQCGAPLCPEDQTLKESVWFPSEEICNKSNALWVKNQKKIASKAKDDSLTCYTFEMLNRNCKIGKAIKGIDPDKDQDIEEAKWLNKHPAKKEMSEDRRAELRERMKKMRFMKAS